MTIVGLLQLETVKPRPYSLEARVLFLWQETSADDLLSVVKRLLSTQPGWEGVMS